MQPKNKIKLSCTVPIQNIRYYGRPKIIWREMKTRFPLTTTIYQGSNIRYENIKNWPNGTIDNWKFSHKKKKKKKEKELKPKPKCFECYCFSLSFLVSLSDLIVLVLTHYWLTLWHVSWHLIFFFLISFMVWISLMNFELCKINLRIYVLFNFYFWVCYL